MKIRSYLKSQIAIFAFITLLVSAGFAQLPAGVVKVTSVEGITEYQLSNGLRVVMFPDQTKEKILINIVYLVGSRNEGYGETGMAHLLEHLLFKGTPKHTNIPSELNSRGASFNATTSYDRTNYFQQLNATDENLNWALEFEADRMLNSFIAKKDLDSEMTVVRNEMESGENSASRITLQQTMATAYQWHNYGKSTIGAHADVENVPIDRLQAFYRKYYQPDNAVLVVAGKFDESKTISIVNRKFGSIPKPTREIPKAYTIEPVQDGSRAVTIERVGDLQFLMAGYHVPAASHSDSAAVSMMGSILGDSPSGRLYKSLVETKKATGVFNIGLSLKNPGYVILGAQLNKTASLDAARETLIQTVETFADTPPTKEEVERYKTATLKNMEASLNDSVQFGSGLTEWISKGDWRLFFLYRDQIKKVTPEDVQRVAKTYLLGSNRTVGMFMPTQKPVRAEIPNVSDADIAGMVKNYKGEATVAAGEAFDSSPANIEARTTRSAIGGLKTAYLPKKNRGETVFIRLNLHFGDVRSLMDRSDTGDVTGRLLMRGTLKHTRQQIQDELDRLKARGVVDGNATGANASFQTTRRNLPELLKLIAEILKEPAFSNAEFEQFKTELLSGLEGGRSEPQSIGSRAASTYFNRYPKGDVRYSGTLDEDMASVKAITLDDVKKFYKDFYGASAGELAIVGDFDAKEITPLVTDLFGKWKSAAKYERVAADYFDVPAASKSIETPDKANAVFLARMNLKMRNDNLDYPALVIGNYILGGGSLNSRLANRIRQKEGLSYSVGSSFSADSLDETGSFNAFAIYAPQNAAQLEAAFKDEINQAIKTGFTGDELEKAKSGWLLSRKTARASDTAVAGTLANYLLLSRTYLWDDELDKKVQALTLEQVNAATKKYITPDKISIFKAGDFAKAKGN